MSQKTFSASDIEQAILPCPMTFTGETLVIKAVQLMSQVGETGYVPSPLPPSDANLLNHAEPEIRSSRNSR